MNVYDPPEAQIVTRLREAERERDELRRRVADLTVIEANLRDSCRIALANLEEERARVAELEAAPGGVAVAGLLGALSAAAEEIDRVRAIGDRAERETDAFFDGEKHGLLEARKMAREHLSDPTPEQRAAAEVLALGQRYQPDSETSAADYLDHIETLASGGLPLDEPWEEVKTDRDRCKWAAAMALAGMVACGAKPGGGT